MGFLKVPSPKLRVSALAVSCPSACVLLTTSSPSPLLRIPCLAPSQGLCTYSYHSSVLNQNLFPLHRSIPQHRGKPTIFHPVLQLLAHYRLPFKVKLLQILQRYSLLSPLPWSFCPSHSAVTGLVMAIINILILILPDPTDTLQCSSKPTSQASLAYLTLVFFIPLFLYFRGHGAYVTPKYPN